MLRNLSIIKNTLPTDFFQQSLPRLPIPKLETTINKYLEASKPLVSEKSYKNTLEICQEFQNNVGRELHQNLIERNARHSNSSFINDFWLNLYLKSRSRLPLNYNPCIGFFQNTATTSKNDQLLTATNIIKASLDFKNSLEDNTLYPEVFFSKPRDINGRQIYNYAMNCLPYFARTYASYLFKAYPLDMSQYGKLFSTARIPGEFIDTLMTHNNSKHIIVIFNGHFYKLDVLHVDNNEPFSPACIYTGLKMIVDDPQAQEPNFNSPGQFTTLPRNIWALARKNFLINNENSVNTIDSALFCLCLDSTYETDEKAIIYNFLGGNSHNRWFDKSLSIIVDANSTSAVNFEHSWGDGVAVLRYITEIVNQSTNDPVTMSSLDSSVKSRPEKLEFVLDPRSICDIQEAKSQYDNKINSLCIEIVRERKINKNIVKKLKLSPDAVIQILLQVAYRRAFGRNVATYESCSTAAFYYGRTETVRPTTEYAIEIAKLMYKRSNCQNKTVLRELFKKASDLHSLNVRNAATGKGFDRHLFALKCVAEEAGIEDLPIFSDENYKFMNHYGLSGSTLSGSCIKFGGFGPVVDDGYAFGYMMTKNMFESNILGYNSNHVGTLSGTFAEAWEDFVELIN